MKQMKKNILVGVCVLMLSSRCSVYTQDISLSKCKPDDINSQYSKGTEVQKFIEQLSVEGFPGCAIAIYSNEGWWTGSAGFAKIEDKSAMQTCHLQYLQSIAKTYLAVGVLKLYEQHKIELDVPITTYLPEKYSRYIHDAVKITVRMLLNHTSGIPEYNSIPGYVTRLLQHPNYPFAPEDYLRYIDGKQLDFAPGSRYAYRNTNYVILALMVDAITGDHAKFLSDNIFQPLGLTNTFYRNDI
jgi:D-alanyl-D-alanine carboxypeptidase